MNPNTIPDIVSDQLTDQLTDQVPAKLPEQFEQPTELIEPENLDVVRELGSLLPDIQLLNMSWNHHRRILLKLHPRPVHLLNLNHQVLDIPYHIFVNCTKFSSAHRFFAAIDSGVEPKHFSEAVKLPDRLYRTPTKLNLD